MRKSSFIALITVFAAFTIVCDSLVGPFPNISGVWWSWIFIAAPINGIILGPQASFFSTLIGVMVGHSIYFRDSVEFLFTMGAPVGAAVSSLVFKGRGNIVLIYYTLLLGAFFATPVSWQLPFWGMWDVYLAFGLLLVSVIATMKKEDLWNTRFNYRKLLYVVALSAFIGLEADVLFRIFILIPCRTYQSIFRWDVGILQSVWAFGAVETSIKAGLSTLVSVVVTIPLIKAIRKMNTALFNDHAR